VNVLLIGGSGQLGTEIRKRWKGHAIAAPSHAELDLGDAGAFAGALVATGADVVVNCAAFHNVDRCEDEPAAAFEYNALAVDALAARCAAVQIRFVTISTDYVFSGETHEPYTEHDAPHPISAYGTSKLAGELLVERHGGDALIVRTCGVYGVRPSAGKGYTFIDRIIAQARAGERVRVVDDVVASPTYSGHLAEALERLVAAKARGLYHVANAGAVTWYEFAVEAVRAAGIDHPIEPVSQSTWPQKARRPKYSALASVRLPDLGISMPDWREGIAAYLRDKASLGV
jgi:dTDP-4-dehydrorhamnose reductase